MRAEPDEEPTDLYEIRLQGSLAASLRREFPTASVMTTTEQTVLYRDVGDSAELDSLIGQLMSLGLVLTQVQPVLEASASVAQQK